MEIGYSSDLLFSALRSYRFQILVFFIVLFIGLTFAHPELLLNDEWITVNQLHQLHEGHQVITNEGKYGLYKNGTVNAYFSAKGNILGYSLLLPLISLPSLWLTDLFGDHFAFFILYLWTFILLMITLSLHFFFREYAVIGRWCWTPAAIAAGFILFFINLLYYIPYSVNNPDSYPEITAVVFTNIILLSIAGTLIFELNQTLFNEPAFSLFGTIVCLFSSSYVFWATGCKDHILTMLLFVGVLLSIIKFHKTNHSWYLSLAFLVTGLLAWARPELALWVFLFICCIWGYSFIRQHQVKTGIDLLLLFCSPVFTIFGALPFFLNNYLVTKNPLLPTGAIYLSEESASVIVQASPNFQQSGSIPGLSVYQILTIKNAVPSSDIPGDILGILFYPHNGSMGIIALIPLFLVMAILAVVLILSGKLQFSKEEINTMIIIAFLAISVFGAYTNNLPQLNMSRGITPDMRYLSPIYVPLTLIGLMIMRRAQVTNKNSINILKKMLVISIVGIPLSLYLTAKAYADPSVALKLDAPLSEAFSYCIFLLAAITLIFLIWASFSNRTQKVGNFLIALLLTVPFIWQIDVSVRFWLFGATGQGYAAWIPVVNILYTFFSSPLFAH